MFPLKAILVGSEMSVSDLGSALVSAGVEVEGRYPNAAELIRAVTESAETPRLLVTVLGSEDDLAQFRQIGEHFPGWPSLVALTGEYDAQAVVRVNRAGAAQIVPVPWLDEDLHAALERVASHAGLSARPGKLIVVAGVAEGCGAITVAVNIAAEAADTWQRPTILAEPSHPVGRLADRLDVRPELTTEQLLGEGPPNRAKLRSTLISVTDHLRLLAGPRFKLPAIPPDPARVLAVVEMLRRSAEVTVIDLPYTFDPLYFDLLASADHAIFVAAQQVPDLHALQRILEAYLSRTRVGTESIVISRYDSSREGLELARIKNLLNFPEVWTIADDPECSVALNVGQPLRLSAPHAKSRSDLLVLVNRLLGPPPESSKPTMGSGLFRWLRGG